MTVSVGVRRKRRRNATSDPIVITYPRWLECQVPDRVCPNLYASSSANDDHLDDSLLPYDVWKGMPGGRLCRYRCSQALPSGGFIVQSADIFDNPFDHRRWLQLESQFQELLIEEAPDRRNEAYPPLEEAIGAHDRACSSSEDVQGVEGGNA